MEMSFDRVIPEVSKGLVQGAGEWLWTRTTRENQFSPHSMPWGRSILSPEKEGQTERQRQQPAVSCRRQHIVEKPIGLLG